jgi:muramoyltetrapeptide carboxypeptidase
MEHSPTIRKPRGLRAGSRVALVAPAGPVTAERLQISQERCVQLDLEPIVFPAALEQQRFLAGADANRLRDLQTAFDADDIDAVWALRGGYGTTRILSQLDLTTLQRTPKPFIGFSDNTAIHVRMFAHGLISFHGPHPGAAFPIETEASFRKVLFECEPAGLLPRRSEDPPPRALVGGRCEAPLVGGNLSLLAALCGTVNSLHADGCLLFIEDIAEPAYRVDRMLTQLRSAGAFDGIVGIAFGRFTEHPSDEDEVIESVMREHAQQLGVPAAADFPFGHVDHNWTLPVGVRAKLDADSATLEITESAVTRS